MRQGDAAGALRIADELIAQSKRSFPGWLGRAVACLNLGRLVEADEAIDVARKLAASDPQVQLIGAMIDQRLGRIDRAVEHLSRLARSNTPQAVEAGVTLAEVYWFAHRRAELASFITAGGAWLGDPRARLAVARIRALTEPDAALADLVALSAAGTNPLLRRVAGFDAVGMLDRAGRYREAFDLAMRLHAEFTPRFDLEGMLQGVREQIPPMERALASHERWITPRVDAVKGRAMVVGLPRSGTTLLEQMLDRHPSISGIGEYDGVEVLGGELISMGRWPRGLSSMPRDALLALQGRYTVGADRLKRTDATHTFDKTLRAWRWLPAIAAVLPEMVCLHVARDPRDTAISILLSYFHPITDGWASSLASIRAVLEAKRALLPRALEALRLPHESIIYEDLIEDPSGHAARCLARMGLAMDERVLTPESNQRAVFTLSHEQVRRPINRSSVGRWEHYQFAFDADDRARWDVLGAAHAARRASR